MQRESAELAYLWSLVEAHVAEHAWMLAERIKHVISTRGLFLVPSQIQGTHQAFHD